jgi:hypothetical protein
MRDRLQRLFALVIFPLAIGGCAGSATGEGEAIASDQEPLSESKCPSDVPSVLTPDADQRLFFVLLGEGVQIYECRSSGGAFTWTFVAPKADLLNPGDRVVGIHFAGPTWQSQDGSTVRAATQQIAPVSGAVPWLLLGAVSHTGHGKMSNVTSIQRLNTVGGLAPPASECDAEHVGAVANVPYSADYFFYRTSPGGGDNPQCGGPPEPPERGAHGLKTGSTDGPTAGSTRPGARG